MTGHLRCVSGAGKMSQRVRALWCETGDPSSVSGTYVKMEDDNPDSTRLSSDFRITYMHDTHATYHHILAQTHVHMHMCAHMHAQAHAKN